MALQVTVPAPPVRGTVALRRSVAKLTAAELADLRKAFAGAMQLSDERGFSYFAGWHGEPFNWCEHHTHLFLPWHRQYLYYFELALQAIVPGVTLPWWDWTKSDAIPAAYLEDPAVPDNPLLVREVSVYRSGRSQSAPPRTPGQNRQAPPLPYLGRYERALQAPTFEAFQTAIESVHDDVHVWVGGIMQDIQWAAYDPLFFAHHVMIDRAWRIWQHRHPGALPNAHLLNTGLRPNGMTVQQTLDVTHLGYEYAGTAAEVPGSTTGGHG
jgi:tyrosinase